MGFLTKQETASVHIFRAAENGSVELWTSSAIPLIAISILERRYKGLPELKKRIDVAFKLIHLVPAKSEIYLESINAGWSDSEDVFPYLSAMLCQADCITTINVKDFKKSKLPVLSPQNLLSNLE